MHVVSVMKTLPGSISLLVEEHHNYLPDHRIPMNNINGWVSVYK